MSITKTVVVLFALLASAAFLFAEDTVQDILQDYDPESLTEAQAAEINEAFRVAGFRPGPELDQLIRAEGFDPEAIRRLAPPPPRPGEQEDPPQMGDTPAGHTPEDRVVREIYQSLEADYGTPDFAITSAAVENGRLLEEYTCEEKAGGVERSIPLSWSGVPDGTTSLAIVMYHYPNPDDKTGVNSYLLLWEIDPSVQAIAYGEAGDGEWYMGQNKDGNAISYTSPCSPSPGIHEYTITLFALASYPEALPQESTLGVDFGVFMDAVEGTEIVGKADLTFEDVHE